MSRDLRRGGGFTLVELLVVIGIIAVLISILLPTLGKARKAAAAIKCQSNVKQIVMGMIMYANEFKGWYPSTSSNGVWLGTSNPPAPTRNEAACDWIHWQQTGNPNAPGPRKLDESAIVKYVNTRGDKLRDLLRCPMDNDIRTRGVSTAGAYLFSFTMNDRIGRVKWDLLPANSFTGGALKSKVIHNPSEKIMMIEEDEPNDGRWVPRDLSDPTNAPDWLSLRHASGNKAGTAAPTLALWGNIKGGHVGMCDGHVEIMSTIEANLPKHWDPRVR
jgi:prepilin-type N-terminal cleavage/methylation domain-containing protein/prepilin-type processing-associated H-X9-DG protein